MSELEQGEQGKCSVFGDSGLIKCFQIRLLCHIEISQNNTMAIFSLPRKLTLSINTWTSNQNGRILNSSKESRIFSN